MASQTTPGSGGDVLTYGNVPVDLDHTRPLAEFRKDVPELDAAERRQIATEAKRVLEGLYVHLPDKLKEHEDADPLGQLDALLARMDDKPDPDFHDRMFRIFQPLRDLHTAYVPPGPLNKSIAFLPFQVEDYVDDDGRRRYVISNINGTVPGFDAPGDFVRGVEVTHWDDGVEVPIAEAVGSFGEANPGGNDEARRALGIDRLTARPLAKSRVPGGDSITITYVPRPGAEPRKVTAEWRVAEILPVEQPKPRAEGWLAMGQGLDYERDCIRLLRRSERQTGGAPRLRTDTVPRDRAAAESPIVREFPNEDCPELPEHCEAKIFRASSGAEYGYIRIRSFKVAKHRSYVAKFAKLLAAMPPDGLVIDVRDNPGGLILAAERLLQLLTAKEIEPTKMQFISTDATEKISELVPEFLDWRASIASDLAAAAAQGTPKEGGRAPEFSDELPISPRWMCNNVGQRYYGPVVLVTNALSYSATEIFAAGFKEHGIGAVLGTDERTGGGGGNVVTHSNLWDNFKASEEAAAALKNKKPTWPLGDKLPRGVDLRVAIRRPVPGGKPAGRNEAGEWPLPGALEGNGVEPDVVHRITLDDVLYGNKDLLEKAAGLLAERKGQRCRLKEKKRRDGKDPIVVETSGFDNLVWFVEGGERDSRRVRTDEDAVEIAFQAGDPDKPLCLEGYRDGTAAPVARRKIRLQPA